MQAYEVLFGSRPEARVSATWGTTDLRIQMDRATRVTMHVTDARSGAPIPMASIAFQWEGGGGSRSGNMPDGRFPVSLAFSAFPVSSSTQSVGTVATLRLISPGGGDDGSSGLCGSSK